MKERTILAKIGGGILNDRNHLKFTLNQFAESLILGDLTNVILIMGGGNYANYIIKAEPLLNVKTPQPSATT